MIKLNDIKNTYYTNKKLILTFLRVLISILIIYYLLMFLSKNNFTLIFEKSNFILILISFSLVSLNIYLQYKRWEILNRVLLNYNDKKILLKSVFFGISSGLITPLKVGEFFGRAYVFKGELFHKAVSIAVFDRFLSLLTTLFFGGIVFFTLMTKYLKLQKLDVIILLTLFFIVIILTLTFYFKNESIRKKFKFIDKIFDYFEIVKKLKFKIFIRLFLLSILFFFTYVFQFALIISSFLGMENLFTFVIIGILVFFTNTVIPPITFGELGIREGAAIFFMKSFEYNPAVGFSASIILFLFNIVIPSVIGLILYLRHKE